jgi:hypothetical protein
LPKSTAPRALVCWHAMCCLLYPKFFVAGVIL